MRADRAALVLALSWTALGVVAGAAETAPAPRQPPPAPAPVPILGQPAPGPAVPVPGPPPPVPPGPVVGRPAPAPAPIPALGQPAPESTAAATTIAFTPARPSLKLGVDTEVEVLIDLTGPDAARFVPLRALATVGTIDPPHPTTPGHFVALYHPPADRFPQVALLLVELGNGAARLHCATRIALEGSTLFPFRTSGGAAVTMRVGDRQFGPLVADKQGHVEIPIDVPPGVRKAQARAVDREGGTRETEVDLRLPPFPRVLLLAPASLEVGSFSEIAVSALDENGDPVAANQLALAASAGLAHPLGGPPGEARFLFEAPVHVGAGAIALSALAPGAVPGRAELAVPMRAAPPRRLIIAASNQQLIVGDARPISLSIAARDRFGNATSAADVFVRVDGRPTQAAVTASGVAMISVVPPARYDGHENVIVDATLGDVAAAQSLHITGGPPVRLTLKVAAARVVADGKRGTELRVQAIDKNGTPTSVSGLSWETPEGRIQEVRVPRDGEYIAAYVPERTREAHRETVAVMASETLRADTSFEVTPPPVRLIAGARTGLFTNFGQTVGPVIFVEGLAPLPLRLPSVHLLAGFSAGFLRGDVTGGGVNMNGTARLETNQFPLLGVARVALSLPYALGVAAEADAGWSWGWVRVTASPSGKTVIDTAIVSAPVYGGGGELSYPLKPGWLSIGVRYLWINLGRTSSGDQISGNSAGLIADLGYKMTF